jgi:hypothetical protein
MTISKRVRGIIPAPAISLNQSAFFSAVLYSNIPLFGFLTEADQRTSLCGDTTKKIHKSAVTFIDGDGRILARTNYSSQTMV